ncbi:type 4a pilus biogenesis protein PilO [candidate division KSB1 bacterium]
MNITYQQRYIVYGAGLAVLMLVWYLAFYNSQTRNISEMKAGIEQINRDLTAAKSSAGGMQKINDEIKSIKEEIEKMQEKIPSKDKLLFVSRAIEKRGKQYGLKFQEVVPQKEILFSENKDSASITKIPINIVMTGEYFALGKFIESLDDFSFLIKAGSVTISADNNYPELEIYLVLYVYLYGG